MAITENAKDRTRLGALSVTADLSANSWRRFAPVIAHQVVVGRHVSRNDGNGNQGGTTERPLRP